MRWQVFFYLVRYRQGMRGRMKAVILELLQEYYRVEEAFQGKYKDKKNQQR